MAGELIKIGEFLKVGQRVEFFLDDDDEKYLSRIEDITDTRLVVAMPVNKKRVPVIPAVDANLYGLAVGTQCRYRFFSKFKRTAKLEGRLPVWEIVLPDKVERFQNREFVRVRVTQRIKVRLIDEDGRIGEPYDTYTSDISGNGISFLMGIEAKEGTQAALEIYDIPEVGTVNVMCRIVRCKKLEKNEGRFSYRIGASFEHLSKPTMNKIVRYLFVVQRRNIARGIEP